MTLRPEATLVVSTRDEDPHGPFSVTVAAAAVELRSIPATRTTIGPDLHAFLSYVSRLECYSVVAFTSPRAVDVAWSVPELVAAWRGARARPLIAAIGSATACRLRVHGIEVDVQPQKSSGATLAEAVLTRGSAAPLHVLWPRAVDAYPDFSERLKAAGVWLDEPSVYRTVPANREDVARLTGVLTERDLTGVCFFSPSAVVSVASALGRSLDPLQSALVGSFGASTSRCLERWGVRPALEASRPDPAVFATELLSALERRGGCT